MQHTQVASTSSTTRRSSLTLKNPYGFVIASLAKPGSTVPFMMPKRVADTPGSQQIKRRHRLRAVDLQGRRMEARREGRLRQEPATTSRAPSRPRPRRRQGRQARPHRMGGDARHPDGGERADDRRDRRHRGAAARPAADGREEQVDRLSCAASIPASSRCASTGCIRRSTIRRCARRWATPSTSALSWRPRSATSVLPALQGLLRLRHAAGQRRRVWRAASRAMSPRRASS